MRLSKEMEVAAPDRLENGVIVGLVGTFLDVRTLLVLRHTSKFLNKLFFPLESIPLRLVVHWNRLRADIPQLSYEVYLYIGSFPQGPPLTRLYTQPQAVPQSFTPLMTSFARTISCNVTPSVMNSLLPMSAEEVTNVPPWFTERKGTDVIACAEPISVLDIHTLMPSYTTQGAKRQKQDPMEAVRDVLRWKQIRVATIGRRICVLFGDMSASYCLGTSTNARSDTTSEVRLVQGSFTTVKDAFYTEGHSVEVGAVCPGCNSICTKAHTMAFKQV
ncbi:Hypothetical protein POVN_LOCUS640 [uncultured virus]|nr:Hypothetical protein POVN_LOCUS640 [uncultured virus]